MTAKPRGSWGIPAAGYAVALILTVAWGRPAFAQQGRFQPPPEVPLNQGQGGATLELPTTPGTQSGNTDALPRLEQQPQGQALTVPSRQLRNQPGYEQVTVTVMNQRGNYVTDLQKSDFKLYLDGQ